MEGALPAGVIVGQRYRLDAKLGEGAMGAVWSAEHIHTRRRVALKLLKAATEEARQRFLREARAASAARHANVVEVFDLLTLDDDRLVMVMELLDGETLAARLARRGQLALDEVAWILGAVIDALAAVHALGIVHRDRKPENVFLELRPGETAPRVKVLDFGVAKLTAREGAAAESHGPALTNTESFLGTPYYMSPEQVFGEKDVDARSDVWSLGIIAYECVTGARPTQADNIGQVMKRITTADLAPLEGVPAEVSELVAKMLERDRAMRPTLGEVARVLDQSARPSSSPPTSSMRASTHRAGSSFSARRT